MIRQLRRTLASIFFLCSSSFAVAQNAQIQGQVTDASGALISKATVRAVNQQTGTERKVQTNGSGLYTIPFLEPSVYKIFAQATGFSTAVSNPITLNVAQNAVLNFKLEVGSESQTVTVDGSGSTLNTTDASVSTVVDRKFVENMPLKGRSFQDLISMTPGVVTQSPQTTASVQGRGDFSVNGQRTESNYYTVDGVSANIGAGYPNGAAGNGTAGSIAGSTALGTTQSLLSVDALQEFRVSSSTYSAEYGRSPGGQFSLVSRSGTNELHGTVFDYLRNDAFDANDWFNNYYGVRKSALRQNDFGGTVGGPIIIPYLYSGHDRSFFFVSYEGLRLTQPTAATVQYVPSLAVRTSATAAVQPLFNAFPLPTGAEIQTSSGALTGVSPFVAAYSLPASINSTSVRLDHRLTGRHSLFLRYADTPTYTSSRTLSSLYRQILNSETATAGLDSILWRQIANSLRVGYARSKSQQYGTTDTFGGATPSSFHDVMGFPTANSTYQYDVYLYISGVGSADLEQYNSDIHLDQWNITDTVAKAYGRHQLRAGIDERRIASTLLPPALAGLGYYYSRAAMVNNQATSRYLLKEDPSEPLFQEFSAFVQDDWRIVPALSISAGIRWEVNPAPTARDGRTAYTVLGDVYNPATLNLAPRGTPLWETSWYNFAPRLGVAWTAHSQSGHETVVRAGGGVFFDTGNQNGADGFNGLGFRATSSTPNGSFPFPSSAFAISTAVAAPYTASTVYAYPRHLQLPCTLQWNTSVDQSLGKAQTLTLSYVGAAGRRLQQQQYRNVASSNKNFGAVYFFPSDVTSNYQALQVRLQRTVAHGLQALASYTWSHSLDYGSTNSSYPLTYGNSDFDVRHNLQLGASWEIPASSSDGLRYSLLRNWGVDLRLNVRTGFPITFLGNTLTDSTGSRYYSGVNYNSANPIYLYGSQYPGGRRINGGPQVSASTAAFTLPSGTSAGNAARNFVRGFGTNQANLAVRRTFPIADKVSMQFRAEAFNVLNHANFGFIDPTVSDAQFGLATNMLNSSLGSVSSLYQQGGARSMQLSLHVKF